MCRAWLGGALAAGAALLLGTGAVALARTAARPSTTLALEGELTIARRTQGQVAERLVEREAALGERVRALYKLTRAGLMPLVADAGARADLTRRRALARRLIVRDLEERAALREELARAQAQTARLETELGRAEEGEVPVSLELERPVAGRPLPPLARDAATGARLAPRGVRFATRAGGDVIAPVTGSIRFAGPIRGRGQGVVIAVGNGVSVVVSGFDALTAARGPVASGAVLGRSTAAGEVVVELFVGDRAIDARRYLAR